MAAKAKKRPQHSRERPVSIRSFLRGMGVTTSKKSSKVKSKNIKHAAKKRNTQSIFFKTSKRSTQKRDKYGRFVKVNQLGIAKQQPARQRDKYGRFVSSASSDTKRDKRGRFVKAGPVWYRRRATVALALIILGTSSAIYFGLKLNKAIVIGDPVAVSSETSATETPPPDVKIAMQESEPTRLRIARVGIDTSFITIGKKTDGTIEVPGRYDAVGWYTLGPTPGELGPSVVVGHVDRPGGIAVFWRLREMVPGDTFEIDRADGSTAKFVVDRVAQVPQDSFPTEEVYGNIDHAGIRLITCGGTFNRTIQRYSHNTVVYGSLITDDKAVSYRAP